MTIRTLFANNISRRIEEVIKVDQADEQILEEELREYVVTDSIHRHFESVLDHYLETKQKPNEGVAVWVSGFFGSGKSSFAKYLGLALQNRSIRGTGAAKLLGERTGQGKVHALLNGITDQIPTEAVIFDVSTDRGIRSGNQSITEIMYRLFLQKLGYARDLDLSELEITLEEQGRLAAFQAMYEATFGKRWDAEKGKVAIAVQQASRVMHEMEPETYPSADSWRQSAMKRADVSANHLAARAMELMRRRGEGKSLVFVIDEVGQFVARDIQKMLDLMGVVHSFGRVGRGKLWLVVTSQERLTEVVGGLDDKRLELARLMDRFPVQVHLAPSDISEVTSKRVLAKNAEAEARLRALFTEHRGRLTDHTRLTADIKLPALSTEAFADLYPLLPYQIDLIIQVVSGLRTQGGASKHVGGANRTIIKLAQQLLIHPKVALAEQPVGALARADQIYDLVTDNIPSEIRGKIEDIGKQADHPLAQPVAKAICLLQYVRSIHRTAENLASVLHPAVDADSRLPEVKAALQELEARHLVRRGDDGYRIPTPAEDDWENQRAGLRPKQHDVNRLHAEAMTALWQPQPSHTLCDVKLFKAGLYLGGKLIVDGDIPVHVVLAGVGKELEEQVEEARKRSQTETKAVFWVAGVDASLLRETEELHRSREVLSRKERQAQTKDETALVAEEKQRLKRHQDEVRRLLKQALLSGTVFFQGKDRSPEDGASDVGKAACKVLGQALPDVFDRFAEAAARVGKKDLESLVTTENLRGLTPVFTQLGLVRDQAGQPVFTVDTGPLAEVFARIENRTSYGEPATGRYLTDELGKEPFGWEFDVVRLLVVALLRAGAIEATSKGQVIESALSLDARTTLTNNNLFRQTSFRRKTTECTFDDCVDASEAFRVCFGREVQELEEMVIAEEIRGEADKHEDELREVASLLKEHRLPGLEVVEQALSHVTGFRRQRSCQALKAFTGCHLDLKEAVKRAAELSNALTEPRLHDLGRARRVLDTVWPFLQGEKDLSEGLREEAAKLADLLGKETFFRDLAAIDQLTASLEKENARRLEAARNARSAVYERAQEQLWATPGWEELNEEQRVKVEGRLRVETTEAIPVLRADADAAPARLQRAVEDVARLVDGGRVACVKASSFFAGGVDSEEQLDQAMAGLKEQCLELLAEGKKVLVQ